MPVLMISSIKFLENCSDKSKEEKSPKGCNCIDISDLKYRFPQIKEDTRDKYFPYRIYR